MTAHSTRRKTLIVRDTLTGDEQRMREQDKLLKRCAEIQKERLEREERKMGAGRVLAAKRKRARYLERCKTCPAMKYFLRHGKIRS